jgi:hypothetical protein
MSEFSADPKLMNLMLDLGEYLIVLMIGDHSVILADSWSHLLQVRAWSCCFVATFGSYLLVVWQEVYRS